MPVTRIKKRNLSKLIKRAAILPFQPGARLNVYTSKQVNALGGIDAFSKAIGNDKPIAVPDFGFTSEEWDEMLKGGI
jgi:hypothetical protein